MRLWDRNLKENTKRYKIIRYLLQEILTKFKKGMNILLITTKLFQHTYLVNLLPKRGNKNNYFDRKKTACQDKQFQDILGGIIFSPNFEDFRKVLIFQVVQKILEGVAALCSYTSGKSPFFTIETIMVCYCYIWYVDRLLVMNKFLQLIVMCCCFETMKSHVKQQPQG